MKTQNSDHAQKGPGLQKGAGSKAPADARAKVGASGLGIPPSKPVKKG